MMATNYYVDPLSGSNSSGSGTLNSPWRTVQHALDNITRNTIDGDRINIRSTADDVLAAPLNLATYGKGNSGPPLIFQGYADTQGDGGIGAINGDDQHTIFSDATQDAYIICADLRLYNCGSAGVLDKNDGDFWRFYNCEIAETSGLGVSLRTDARFERCLFRDIGGVGVQSRRGHILACRFVNGPTRKFTTAAFLNRSNEPNVVADCIFDVDGVTRCIIISNNEKAILRNIFHGGGGTGKGIEAGTSGGRIDISHNVITGFSGAGASGIDWSNNRQHGVFVGNAFYDNAANEVGDAKNFIARDNVTLTADPFADAANGNFNINDVPGGGAVLRDVDLPLGDTTLYPFGSWWTGGGASPRIISPYLIGDVG